MNARKFLIFSLLVLVTLVAGCKPVSFEIKNIEAKDNTLILTLESSNGKLPCIQSIDIAFYTTKKFLVWENPNISVECNQDTMKVAVRCEEKLLVENDWAVICVDFGGIKLYADVSIEKNDGCFIFTLFKKQCFRHLL